jgi:hypothetical protein
MAGRRSLVQNIYESTYGNEDELFGTHFQLSELSVSFVACEAKLLVLHEDIRAMLERGGNIVSEVGQAFAIEVEDSIPHMVEDQSSMEGLGPDAAWEQARRRPSP